MLLSWSSRPGFSSLSRLFDEAEHPRLQFLRPSRSCDRSYPVDAKISPPKRPRNLNPSTNHCWNGAFSIVIVSESRQAVAASALNTSPISAGDADRICFRSTGENETRGKRNRPWYPCSITGPDCSPSSTFSFRVGPSSDVIVKRLLHCPDVVVTTLGSVSSLVSADVSTTLHRR